MILILAIKKINLNSLLSIKIASNGNCNSATIRNNINNKKFLSILRFQQHRNDLFYVFAFFFYINCL